MNSNFGTYTLIFFLVVGFAKTATPVSSLEIAATFVTLIVLAGEVHHAMLHNGVNLAHPIRYTPLPLLAAFVICLLAYRSTSHERGNADPSEAKYVKLSAEAARHKAFGLFDEMGRFPYEMVEQFRLSSFDTFQLTNTPAGQRLLSSSELAFGRILSRSAIWVHTMRFDPTAGDSIAMLFNGFQEKVQHYLGSLPQHLVAVETDLTQSTRWRSSDLKVIEEHRELLEGLYDSLAVAIATESVRLQSAMVNIGKLLSEPTYWDPTKDPPRLTRKDIARSHSRLTRHALRSIRIIENSRDAIHAYGALLTRSRLVLP